MRLTPEDAEALNDLAERVSLPRLTIARMALRVGIEVAKGDPSRLLLPRARTWVVKKKKDE